MMAPLKRYKFHVNTLSDCFLCSENVDENLGESSFSLQNIFSYLNIELRKIETLSTKPTELLNETDVRVSLCHECGKVLKEITKLYKNMEVIKIKLDYNFEFIQKKMKFSQDENLKMHNALIKIEESSLSEDVALRHSHRQLVKELRKEILSKYNLKMPNYQPRIHLERVPDSRNQELKPMITNLFPKEQRSSNVETLKDSSDSVPAVLTTITIKQEGDDYLGGDGAAEEVEGSDNCSFLTLDDKACKENDIHPDKQEETHPQSPKKAKKLIKQPISRKLPSGEAQCLTCDKILRHTRAARYHFSVVHLKKRWKCDICNISDFTHESSLWKHKQIFSQTLKKRAEEEEARKHFKYICLTCGKKFPELYALPSHQAVVHSTKSNTISCDRCNKTFKSAKTLMVHTQSAHLNKTWPCKSCAKIFLHKSSLFHHERKCHKNDSFGSSTNEILDKD